MAANACCTPAAAASADAKNESVVKLDGFDAEEEELKATFKALLDTDCLTLKSYARSVLMAAKTDDTKKAEIKMIENQLLDLARAIQEAGELLLDLPLPLITTKICPFLPTRTDWNNFLLVKKSLREFAKTAPISTFLPPWPLFPRPSKFVYLEDLPYQYTISQDGQFIACFETPPGMNSSHFIHVFSRKHGYVAVLQSQGQYPIYQIHLKQKHEIVTEPNGVTLEEGSTTVTDVSGNKMTTTTYVQSFDAYGRYLEWKLFPTRHDYTDEPKTNAWSVPALGAVDAPVATFSEDGNYLLRVVGRKRDEIVVQAVSNQGKTVLRYKSTKIKRFGRTIVLSPNNKLLALTRDLASQSGSAIFEVCELIDDGTNHGLKVGLVFTYEDSTPLAFSPDARFTPPLAFSPDSAKLAMMLPGSPYKIAVWDTSRSAFSSSSSSFFLPLLHTLGNMKPIVDRIFFSSNGKHLIIKCIPVKIDGSPAGWVERYQGTVEIWSIEDNQLLHSLPCRTLEAVSHSMVATGDRTFILVEERDELKPPRSTGGQFGDQYEEDSVEKTVQVHELDGNGRLLTFIHPKKARCAKCSKREDELHDGKVLLRCTRCKEVTYCSKGCQKAHWKVHKKSCNISEVD